MSADDYEAFLRRKTTLAAACGLPAIPPLCGALFPFQRDIVDWALRLGRALIGEDCGLGKTIQQLEWARHIPGDVLILTPLAVAQQTIREAERFGIAATYCRTEQHLSGITVTNYEMMEHFDLGRYTGVVLDESSILKAFDGKTRTRLIDAFRHTPYRLACTATPAPNDYMELGNHAEFLGVMTRAEMLSMFFVHDGGETQTWRLKGHAQEDFWRWVASWSVMIRRPSDIGYDDGDFLLPPMRLHEHVLQLERAPEGQLFPTEALTLQERIRARRDSLTERVQCAAQLISASSEQWLVWCGLNSESEALCRAIQGAVQIQGSDSLEDKESRLMAFIDGRARVLVSKPSIAGRGLNLQRCHNVAFVGLSDSWEDFYQATRRSWRFGQTSAVDVHLIISDAEGAVLKNIMAKDAAATAMADNLVIHMRDQMRANVRGSVRTIDSYDDMKEMTLPSWLNRMAG